MVTATLKELKVGDPIEYKTSNGWFPGKFCSLIATGKTKSQYVRIKCKNHGLYSYSEAKNIRPVKSVIEDDNPNRTFKLRRKE